MSQLHTQDSSLDCIETSVVSLDIVVILLGLAMIAQHLSGVGNARIIGGDCPPFATGSQVLPRVKTECSGTAYRTSFEPPTVLSRKVFSAVSLACVFNDDQAILLCQIENWVHIHHLPIKVNRDDGGHQPITPVANEFPIRGNRALRSEERRVGK